MELVRFSPENPNTEAIKGKFGVVGEIWGKITVIKNVVFIIAYKGAKVSDYVLPECYDGFVQCSDGSVVQINDSKLSLDLGPEVTAHGFLQLRADN
jgi:hypothetical protein